MDHDETCICSKTDTALPKAETCLGKIEIPTNREQKALRKLKAIKERVRELRSTIKSLQEDDPEKHSARISHAGQELVRMKIEWDTWEAEKNKAAKERMFLLGHEEATDDPPSAK